MLHLPNLKYPSKLHCEKVASFLEPHTLSQSILLAKGQVTHNRDNTDSEVQFHQESNFYYLTGVDEPDYFFVYHFATSTSYLVAPDVDVRLTVWKGPVPSNEELLKKYDVDHVVRYSDLLQLLKNELKPRRIYGWNQPEIGPALADKNIEHELKHYITDRLICQKQSSTLLNKDHEEGDDGKVRSLFEAFLLARIHKTPIELALSREATRISSDAHRLVMQHARVGLYEYQIEHLFRYECGRRGGRMQGYLPIVGRGVNAAYLHYTRNNERIRPGDLLLIDAACEFEGYTSDITRTFPVSGRFTKEQGEIYKLVFEMQNSVLQSMKAGVDWQDMRQLSREIGLQGLKKLGILVGNIEDLRENNIISLFYPHGLGHLLGLNVHDDGLGLSASQPPESDAPKKCNKKVVLHNDDGSSTVEIHTYSEEIGSNQHSDSFQDDGARFLQELLSNDPLPPPSTRRHQRAVSRTKSSTSGYATTSFVTPGTLLEPGMLLTVEPGIYFSPLALSLALENPSVAQYIDEEVLQRYMSVGGVRIEDVVYIRPDGRMENITTAPKAMAEIEQIVQEALLERAKDECQPLEADKELKKANSQSGNVQHQHNNPEGQARKEKRAGPLKRLWRALKALF
ncbi:hypothetical protein BGW41_002223 [Actinomortierella wolfii]|nr:hypothetical protein BGW41_002223 [Actinomortierella wolfii]